MLAFALVSTEKNIQYISAKKKKKRPSYIKYSTPETLNSIKVAVSILVWSPKYTKIINLI